MGLWGGRRGVGRGRVRGGDFEKGVMGRERCALKRRVVS
jgi:hypothetical protein